MDAFVVGVFETASGLRARWRAGDSMAGYSTILAVTRRKEVPSQTHGGHMSVLGIGKS